jgi:phosphoribosylformylglycinamidine cyclo-ligase
MTDANDAPLTYRRAGVDVAAADSLVERIAALAATTHGRDVLAHPSQYAGLLRMPARQGETSILAATCDGVGTKLLVARQARSFAALGQDLVAMSVNDLAALGARPLLFLDYVAAARLEAETIITLVDSMARACREVGCALLGGETAEMPGLYARGDFDLAGFAVGCIDEERMPRPERMQPGDTILALPSSGIHANGFSLARAALFERAGLALATRPAALAGRSLAEELLRPTLLYCEASLALFAACEVRAAAHVTGGGLLGRLAKLARPGCTLIIDPDSYERPPIFGLIARAGEVTADEMASTFNMGLGFVAIVPAAQATQALRETARYGWHEVGRCTRGPHSVELGYARR